MNHGAIASSQDAATQKAISPTETVSDLDKEPSVIANIMDAFAAQHSGHLNHIACLLGQTPHLLVNTELFLNKFVDTLYNAIQVASETDVPSKILQAGVMTAAPAVAKPPLIVLERSNAPLLWRNGCENPLINVLGLLDDLFAPEHAIEQLLGGVEDRLLAIFELVVANLKVRWPLGEPVAPCVQRTMERPSPPSGKASAATAVLVGDAASIAGVGSKDTGKGRKRKEAAATSGDGSIDNKTDKKRRTPAKKGATKISESKPPEPGSTAKAKITDSVVSSTGVDQLSSAMGRNEADAVATDKVSGDTVPIGKKGRAPSAKKNGANDDAPKARKPRTSRAKKETAAMLERADPVVQQIQNSQILEAVAELFGPTADGSSLDTVETLVPIVQEPLTQVIPSEVATSGGQDTPLAQVGTHTSVDDTSPFANKGRKGKKGKGNGALRSDSVLDDGPNAGTKVKPPPKKRASRAKKNKASVDDDTAADTDAAAKGDVHEMVLQTGTEKPKRKRGRGKKDVVSAQ